MKLGGVNVEPPPNTEDFLKAMIAEREPTVTIAEGHQVKFAVGVSKENKDQAIKAYQSILDHILGTKRFSFLAACFVLWVLPLVVIFMFGFAVKWVAGGFATDMEHYGDDRY